MRYIIKSAGRCGSHYLQEYMSTILDLKMEEINYGKYSNTCNEEYFKYLDSLDNVIIHNHGGFIPTNTSDWNVIFLTRTDNLLDRAISVWFTRYTKQNNINIKKVKEIENLSSKTYKILLKDILQIVNGMIYCENDIKEELKEHNWKNIYNLEYKNFINNPRYISNFFNINYINNYEQKKYARSIFSIKNVKNYDSLKEKFDKTMNIEYNNI